MLSLFSIIIFKIFVVLIPTTIAYFFLFSWLEIQRLKLSEIKGGFQSQNSTQTFDENRDAVVRETLRHEDSKINKTLTMENFRAVWPKIRFLTINLATVSSIFLL